MAQRKVPMGPARLAWNHLENKLTKAQYEEVFSHACARLNDLAPAFGRDWAAKLVTHQVMNALEATMKLPASALFEAVMDRLAAAHGPAELEYNRSAREEAAEGLLIAGAQRRPRASR